MFSCSNDTTIKIWGLADCFHDVNLNDKQAPLFKSTATLNDENDYVRAFAYSE